MQAIIGSLPLLFLFFGIAWESLNVVQYVMHSEPDQGVKWVTRDVLRHLWVRASRFTGASSCKERNVFPWAMPLIANWNCHLCMREASLLERHNFFLIPSHRKTQQPKLCTAPLISLIVWAIKHLNSACPLPAFGFVFLRYIVPPPSTHEPVEITWS